MMLPLRLLLTHLAILYFPLEALSASLWAGINQPMPKRLEFNRYFRFKPEQKTSHEIHHRFVVWNDVMRAQRHTHNDQNARLYTALSDPWALEHGMGYFDFHHPHSAITRTHRMMKTQPTFIATSS